MASSFTVLENGRAHELAAEVRGGQVWLKSEALRSGLGWELKPEGLCRGDVCVPVRDRSTLETDAGIDLEVLAAALGQPLALDAAEGAASLGVPAQDRANQLLSLAAPDFELPALDGTLHRLSDHRGKKVLLIAYASW